MELEGPKDSSLTDAGLVEEMGEGGLRTRGGRRLEGRGP